MSEARVVEHFFGVYLLYCLNPKYKGRTYVGYTVDPNRRIKQHNKGKKHGGAWKTSNKGPWTMVLIVHGFPNDVSALRFEWAWQHPHVSRRLRHVPKKKPREKIYDFHIRVLSEMLSVAPWYRLPLTVRWLNEEFIRPFPVEKQPPNHMPICHGPVISKKVGSLKKGAIEEQVLNLCNICYELIDEKQMRCLNLNCDLNSHIVCLSKYFLQPGEYVPVEGKCPKCKHTFLWGDLVRKYKGCYNNLDMELALDNANEFYYSDSE
ncbi:unnamed protein product [Callosobruchus maculatus]|uniref:Structure-specific endonuclease subunit SLX1 homolog n=1 Tax=Callosobruchus maculatus TaxID=64391 RepID=A0A653BGU7_CALMS|nr:unnamed protein product [Callosobruchus maculatus]